MKLNNEIFLIKLIKFILMIVRFCLIIATFYLGLLYYFEGQMLPSVMWFVACALWILGEVILFKINNIKS